MALTPDEKGCAAAEEVANYEGEPTKLRLEIGERFREAGERMSRLLGAFAQQWQILLRLPS